MEKVINRIRSAAFSVRDNACDYYSLVPLGRIILFNLAFAGIFWVILSLPDFISFFGYLDRWILPVNYCHLLACTAANAVFYSVCRRRSHGEYEHAAGKTVIKRLLITVIADFIFCSAAELIVLHQDYITLFYANF